LAEAQAAMRGAIVDGDAAAILPHLFGGLHRLARSRRLLDGFPDRKLDRNRARLASRRSDREGARRGCPPNNDHKYRTANAIANMIDGERI
jgi:hypothetical protein